MILPIHIYGDPILRTQTQEVEENTEALQALIDDMIESMHGAAGIGLAAPQIGRPDRLFVVDLTPLLDDFEEEELAVLPSQPMVFINPEIVWESEEVCELEEGCLSIPDLREIVERPVEISIRYLDRAFEPREIEAGGFLSRVIQHEYDHLEGILFVDLISAFRRRLLRRRLREMAQGKAEADYPIKSAG